MKKYPLFLCAITLAAPSAFSESLFKVLDTDRNGAISETEFIEFWNKNDLSGDTGPSGDQDGKVSESEWPQNNEMSKRIFFMMDMNRDGVIEVEESTQFRKPQFKVLKKNEEGEVERDVFEDGTQSPLTRFQQFDSDGDESITEEEFIASLMNTYLWYDKDMDGYVSADEWPGDKAEFQQDDSNGDGKLSREESQVKFEQWFRRLDKAKDGALSKEEMEW